jgi:hypothetical protein
VDEGGEHGVAAAFGLDGAGDVGSQLTFQAEGGQGAQDQEFAGSQI